MAAEVKPRNNRVLMIVGVVIAFIAAALVIITGGGKSSDNSGARNQPVVVSAVDIPAGQQVSDSLVKVVNFAVDQVPVGAQTDPKKVVGQYAAVALPKNSVLSGSNLVATTAQLPAAKKPYLDIPAGQVAIAIPAGGELQAVAGYIQQGDRVDIIYNPNGASKAVWKTTYQNLKVARLGGPAAPAASGSSAPPPGVASSMVVYVSLQDAETLTLLFANGNFKLALRSQADAGKNDQLSGPGATPDTLFAQFNIPK